MTGHDAQDALGGDALLRALTALAHPHRLRILAALADRREYVSRLARRLGIGRPLLHMHLQRLEAAGLVIGTLELSDDGKAMKYFQAAPFAFVLDPASIAWAVGTLSDKPTLDSPPALVDKEAT